MIIISLYDIIYISAEEDIYEDAEQDDVDYYEDDDFEYYEVGAGDGNYNTPAGTKLFLAFCHLFYNNCWLFVGIFLDTTNGNHNGAEGEESMDIEAGQFEDAEEDP